ncbi:beta strand repeat-containing protein [Vandammella animalimorsus]|uniref:beta strand repeat-containing protein n=1 Tax=Vandammella animalimorsus TaxID=2029117 RepID=UPI001EEE26ED|nr:SdrD B-like domain-containing protein [Vandammella animalimorsus]
MALSLLVLGSAWSSQALAGLSVAVAKVHDGTGTCALDADVNNGVLCTNDEARYKVDYQVSPPPVAQDNVRITVSLPATEPFRFAPTSGGLAACRNATSALSADGRTVDCLLAGSGANPPNGPIANQSGTLFFDVTTNSQAQNGSVLSSVTGKIVSDQDAAGASGTAPGVTVVAKPQIDLVKSFIDRLGAMDKPAGCNSPATGKGIALIYTVALNIPETKGHESLQQGWTYTDDISGLGADACVYRIQSYRERNNRTFPAGGVPANVPVDAGTGSYSFAQAGNSVTVTASTTNPPLTSGEVTGTWPGAANATALHYVTVWIPKDTATNNGASCQYSPRNRIEELTAQGLSGVPNAGDDPANNVVTTNSINVCSGAFEKLFYATSKGRSAPLIHAPSNRMSNDMVGPGDFIDSYLLWSNTGLSAVQVSLCDHWDNRKLRLDLFDPSVHGIWTAPPRNPAVGANSPYRWKKLPTTSTNIDYSPGYAHFYRDSGAAGGVSSASAQPEDEEVQFGFSAFGNGDETMLRDASCNDGDSTLSAVAAAAGVPTTGILPSGWITQSALEANPALVPFINSARLLNANVPAGGRVQMFVHLNTLPANPQDGVTWPDGSIIPNYGLQQSSVASGFEPGTLNWMHSSRAFMGNDPNATLLPSSNATCLATSTDPARYCDDAYSDRLRLSTQSVGIRKGIEGVDPVGGPAADNPVVPKTKGQIVTYQLWPRLVSNQPGVTIPNDLILIDTIPAGMRFVSGSLKWGGAPVPAGNFHLDDQSATFAASTLRIRLPNVNASNPAADIAVIEFQAEIMLDAPGNIPNASLINQVEIRGCAPGASVAGGALSCVNQTAAQRLAERQATRTVRLGAIDGLVVQKSVIGDALKQIGSGFTMELRYQNVGNETVHEHRLIDVLPYNGEPPRGGTRFSGTRPIAQVRAPAATGYAVYYTSDEPATINRNPKCPSNITAVTGNWPAYAPGVPAAAAGCAHNSGSTNWVLATQAGANWTVPADTTALLMKDTAHFASGAASRAFQLDFNTPGSRHDDVYANNFSGAHGSLGTAVQEGTGARFDVTSNNVQVKVFASSIQGTVFVDPDGNGASAGFDPAGGDTGLGGQTVTLQRAGMADRSAVTATADIAAGKFYNPVDGSASDTAGPGLCPVPAAGLAVGQYLFCDLEAGQYTLLETQPAGYETTGNKAGTAGGAVAGDTISAIDLPANDGNNPNANATGYDFGERALTSVTGRVYVEGNGNTSDDGDATDPGLGGVTVTLVYTPPGGGAPVTLSATTATDGSYAFSGLPVGATNVTITESQPPGFANAYNTAGTNGAVDGGGGAPGTTDNSVITIATLLAGGSQGNNFAEQALTSVTGRVYVEGNGNTSDDGNATDPGIGGVTVTLRYTPPGGGAQVTLTETTTANGSYVFNGLPVGATDVSITESQPSGYENVYNTPGSNGAVNGGDNAGTATDSVITIATLAAGGSQNNNFAEQRQTTLVSGRVYVESNGNISDDGNATDPGIGGVTVTLVYTPPGGGAPVTLNTTTAADGSYTFGNLPVGATNVTITETQPANYLNVYNTPGTNGAVNGGDNPGTATNSVITIATLTAGGSTGNNFAEQRQSTSVSGRVYREGNGNTADDGNATDPGINGVTVTLRYTPPGGGAPVEVSVTTGPDGSYSFNDLPVGATDVTITESQPTGYENAYNTPGTNGAVDGGGGAPGTTDNSVITIATLTAGGSTGNNFAEQRQNTSVSGRVYREGNGNTADDGNATDPGINGVTVTLRYTPPGGGAPVEVSVTTGPDGSYSFNDLPVGATDVTITESQPTGYENAYNTPGTNGAVDGGGGAPGTTDNSVITIATLTAGGSTGNNFAERGAVSDMTSAIACTVSGTSATCELTCTNNGPSAALNATCGFTSALPSGVTVSCTPNSPQATLAVGESIVCKTSPFPVPSSPLDVHGGTGADNDSKGGTDPAAGNNPSRTTLGAPAPSTVPVPTLGLGGVLLLALALMVAAGLRRRVA